MAKEPGPDVLHKLAQATARRGGAHPGGAHPGVAPPSLLRPSKQPTVVAGAPGGLPPGAATASYLLVDHYFGGSAGTFWAYDGSQWHPAGTNQPADEEGIAQVAFASNRVDVDWDDGSNALTLARCWKYL
jgi:hypothetical protein